MLLYFVLKKPANFSQPLLTAGIFLIPFMAKPPPIITARAFTIVSNESSGF